MTNEIQGKSQYTDPGREKKKEGGGGGRGGGEGKRKQKTFPCNDIKYIILTLFCSKLKNKWVIFHFDWLKIKVELTLHIMNFDLDPINLTQWPACPNGSRRKGERVLFLNCLTACK